MGNPPAYAEPPPRASGPRPGGRRTHHGTVRSAIRGLLGAGGGAARTRGAMVPAGSVALVTGAARRLGRAIALRLARGGCRVAVHYRGSRGEAEALVREIRAEGGEAR